MLGEKQISDGTGSGGCRVMEWENSSTLILLWFVCSASRCVTLASHPSG